MITAISPFMNGELPISAPVSGLRRGAPDGSVSKAKTTRTPGEREAGEHQPARFVAASARIRMFRGVLRSPRSGGLPAYLPSRGSITRWVTNVITTRQQDDRGDREPEVGGQTDRDRRVRRVDGVVRELGQDRVERLDEHVHGERAGDRGKAGGQSRERMPADAQECDARQRNQHEIAGVRRDARQNAHEDQDVGDGPTGRDRHQLANERLDQSGLLGHADADHRHDDQPHRREAHEARNDRAVDEAEAFRGEQAPGRHGAGLKLLRRRVDHLLGDGRARQMQDMRQQHDQNHEGQEDDHRVRHLVARLLDDVQQLFLESIVRLGS